MKQPKAIRRARLKKHRAKLKRDFVQRAQSEMQKAFTEAIIRLHFRDKDTK